MRKYNFVILVLFMSITFLSLLALQAVSTSRTTSMLQNQFIDGVQRSLYRTVVEVEELEVRTYLDSAIMAVSSDDLDFSSDDNYSKPEVNLFLSQTDSILKASDTDILVNKANVINSSIAGASNAYSVKYKEKFLRSRSLLDMVTTRMINDAPGKSVYERIDMAKLGELIKANLYNNGIELDFHYAVVDKYNNIIFSYHGEEIDLTKKSYKQKFFPSLDSEKKYFLYVYFYDEQDYYKEAMMLVVPFAVITIFLLVTFMFTLYYIFRQKKLNELKNDFVNNMTHELKTPVSSISLAAQMLNDPVVGKSPQFLAHVSRVIKEETKRLSFQVDKVLQMSVFEREKTILAQRDTDANAMIDTILSNFSLKVSAKGGVLHSKLKAFNSFVYADEMHLGNVIYNLMDNAIKYSKDEPLILTVATWNAENRFFVSIEDNGIGIKKEYQKQLFDKFYRVPTGNRHDVKGFGLGLSYVKKIVGLHKGRITVESEYNVGTKFIISLPLLEA